MMFTNQMRFTGMSGLDVNDMVTQLMRAHSMRLDRVRQNRDVVRWQQEKQHGIIAQMRGLQREFLTAANSSRNMLFPSNFQARSTTITNSDGTPASGINISTTGNTPPGHRSVQVQSVARNDVFRTDSRDNLNNGIRGTTAINFDRFQPTSWYTRNSSQFARDDEMAGFHSWGYYIGNERVAAGTPDAVRYSLMENDQGELVRVRGRHVYLRGGDYTDDEGYRLDGPNGDRIRHRSSHNGGLNFTINVNGNPQTIYIPASAMFVAVPDGNGNYVVPNDGTAVLQDDVLNTPGGANAWLENQINNILSTRFGHDNGQLNDPYYQRVSVSIGTDGHMTIHSRPGHQVQIFNSSANRPSLASIGFTDRQSTTTNLNSVTMEEFMGGNGAFNFTINGRNFNFDGTTFTANGTNVNFGSEDLTLQQVLNAVNSANTGATLGFNANTNRFTLTGNHTGAHNAVSFSGNGGCDFFERLGFGSDNNTLLSSAEHVAVAADSVVIVNGNKFQRTTNSFEVEGMRITLDHNNIDLTNGPVHFNVNIQANTEHTMDLIRNFVEEYNNLIRSIRDLTHTRAPRSSAPGRRGRFLPLTEDQRRAMSDREIELWEEQARTGILHRDSVLQSFTSRLHNEIFRDVQFADGSRLNLLHIGIRTDSDLQNFGELQINEERLEQWLNERPDDVMRLFTQADNRPAGNNNTQNRPGRLHHSGVAARINDIINWELSPGGALFEHAGFAGGDGENRLSRRITHYDQRSERMMADLARRENRYFMMFSRLEAALTAGQNQMMFLEQMMWAG